MESRASGSSCTRCDVTVPFRYSMSALDHLYDQAKRAPKRVLLPEATDERIREAASICAERGLANPVFLDDHSFEPKETGTNRGAELFSSDPGYARWLDQIDPLLANATERLSPETKAGEARNSPPDLYVAAALLKVGYVDLVVAGASATSADVLRAGIRVLGLEPGATVVSSAYLLELKKRFVTFADCSVIPVPTSEQLTQIASNAAKFHRRVTGHEPVVAFLAYSTKGSADNEALATVRAAVESLGRKQPDLAADGEMQFDCAFVPEIGRRKAPESSVAGRANVFVFPDLNAANIGCKIAIHMGHARAIGPFLRGISRTWIDIPRGSRVDEIVDTIVTASALVEQSAQSSPLPRPGGVA